MAVFDLVETDCGGDETIGLMAESGTTLYQLNTVATISPNGQVSEKPTVQACGSNDVVCVAADRQLLLFQDEGHQFLYSVGLDSQVDCVACSEHGDFVAVGESSGCLHFMATTFQHPLISQQLIKTDKLESQGQATFTHIVFTPMSEEGTCQLLVLASQGRVYHFQNLQLTHLKEALVSKDIARLKHLQKDIKVDMFDATCVHTETTLCVQWLPSCVGSSILTVGGGEMALAMWNKSGYSYVCSKASPSAIECPLTKVATTKCGKSLFTLDSESHLMLWSSHTLTCMQLLRDSVVDFSLQETAEEVSGLDHVKLVMLTVDQDDICSLQICCLPCLEPLYQLQLSKSSWLVSCPSSQESVLLVEGETDETSPLRDQGDLIDSLKVRCLMETMPETRLLRLLNKKHFEKAESFAKLFNLDVELVYKTKASAILNELSPWGESSQPPPAEGQLLVQLKDCLINIHNEDFVVECCIKAPLSKAGDVFDLLTFARNRLEKSQSVGNGHSVGEVDKSALLTKVLETLHRLNTYFVTYGVHNFTGERWEEFRKISLVWESLRYLSLGDISKVICLWSRHPGEFDTSVSCDFVEDILANISPEIPSKELTCWLTSHLTPFIVRQCRTALVTFVSWLEQRARNLEILEKDDWPHNALHMCDLPILRQFTTEDCDLLIASEILKEQLDDTTGAFKKLATLVLHLRQFNHFCSQYNCQLSFAEYQQETTETLAYRMLDRVVATELIPGFIAKTIQPYTAEHGLDADRILYEYVKSLTEWSFKMTLQVEETAWETKAISIIACIHNNNYKIDAILDVILRAYIPWSCAMDDLVNEGLAMKHPRVAELQDRCLLAALRKMLTMYDLSRYNVSETSNAQRLVCHIINKDRVTAVVDALEVVKAYSHLSEDTVYLARLRFLIEHDRQEESMVLLRSLPQQLQIDCGKQLVTGTRLLLCNNGSVFNRQKRNAQRLLHTHSSYDILRHLLTLDLAADEQEDFEELLSNLQNIRVLQVEFGEFLSYEDYCNDDIRQAMCKKWLSQRQAGMRDYGDKKPGLAASSDRSIYRLAQVLGISTAVLCGQQIMAAIDKGSINTALHWCRHLCGHLATRETAKGMFDTARRLCSLLATQAHGEGLTELPRTVTELAGEALTHCSADLLSDCLQLCRSTTLAGDVLLQCHTTDFSVSVQGAALGGGEGGRDPLEWAFDDFFHEDGLMMDAAEVTSSLYNYTLVSGPAHAMAESSPQHLVTAVAPVISLLKDSGHLSLAVQYCVDTVTTMTQHVTSETMGFTDLSLSAKEQQTQNLDLLQSLLSESLSDITQMTSSLLTKVLGQWPVDHALGVGLLCSLPHRLALELLQQTIKRVGFHYKHILAVVRVGKDFASLCGDQKTHDVYEQLELDAFWGHKLIKCKVSFKSVFGLSHLEKRPLLPLICRSPAIQATDIRQYCSDYMLEEDEPLMMHLKHLLRQCAALSPGGATSQTEDTTRVMSLLTAAAELIDGFHNTELLLQGLEKMVTQISPYDYVSLEFVLDQTSRLISDPSVKKHQKLLRFLSEYKRVAPLSSYELNYSSAGDKQLVIEDRAVPAVAHTRLPFHPLAQGAPWKIISPELDIDTLPVWLPVISLLQLSTDQVYITAIHNIVHKHLEPADRARQSPIGSTPCHTALSSDGASFLDTVQSVLCSISSAELAVGCSNWVVKELPLGEEKVAVAKWNMELSMKWLEGATTDAERDHRKEIHGKICERYRRLATEQVLEANHLTQTDLLQLTSTPAKLIFRLYQHYSMLTNSLGSRVTCQPDINKIADEIAHINQVNVKRIQLNLIEKWFRSTSEARQDNLDVTLDVTMCQTDGSDEPEAENNLMRVNYLLQYMPTEAGTKFLLGYAFATNTSTKISHLGRVRALRCLFSLTDSLTIERLSGMTTDHIRSVMCGLQYIVGLEELQMSQTLESFRKCNKVGLVKTILRSHGHKGRAVRLAAQLCLDYSIFEVPLWTNILKQLLTFQMVDFLHDVLIRLLPVPALWQVSSIGAVWKAVLMAPLLSAAKPLAGPQLDDCLRTLVLLHRFPLLQDLDLAAFCHCFLQLDLPVCAAACAQLIPAADTRTACLTHGLTLTSLQQQLQQWTHQASTDLLLQQLILIVQPLDQNTQGLVSVK